MNLYLTIKNNLIYKSINTKDLLIFLLLYIFSSWTLSYHIVLSIRLPAVFIIIFFILLLILIIIIGIKFSHHLPRFRINKYIVALLFISSLLLLFSTIVYKPDLDDVSFFHRAYVQFYNWLSPIYTYETSYNQIGLPPLSILHLLTSYEYFCLFLSSLLFMDPVLVYQNIMPAIFSFLLPIVYFCIFKTFGLKNKNALLATVLTALFLLIDGNLQRSFGNISFIRLWQGKKVLWTLGIPLYFVTVYRFLHYPSIITYLSITMIGISAIGLSNSGIYLAPVLIISVFIAYSLNELLDKNKTYVRTFCPQVLLIVLSNFYCLIITLSIICRWLPTPQNTGAWTEGWPQYWLDNIRLVIGSNTSLMRDLLILFVLPWISLSIKKARFLIIYSSVLVLLCFNPLLGPLWMKIILPGSYWRLVYLLPLPFCVGLLINYFQSKTFYSVKRNLLEFVFKTIIFLLVIISVLTAHQWTTFSPNKAKYKYPLEYKFDSEKELRFCQSVKHLISNKNLLAPVQIVSILPLLNPTVRLEVSRSGSIYYFNEIGNPAEGTRRWNAYMFIAAKESSPICEGDFISSIRKGVNSIIIENKIVTKIITTLSAKSINYKIAYQNENYTLLFIESK